MNWKVLKNAIAAGKPCYKDNLLRKCGLLAHTSPAFLKNCWIKKLFISPAARMNNPLAKLLKICYNNMEKEATFMLKAGISTACLYPQPIEEALYEIGRAHV